MLGIRLDERLTRRLDSFATRKRTPKSEIARRAIDEYLERHDFDETEFLRQVRAMARAERDDPVLDYPFTEFDD